MVLEGMMDRLIDTARCYIMDMNVENTEVMNISRQSFPVQMTTTGECGIFRTFE
jgi:hypothetical protein